MYDDYMDMRPLDFCDSYDETWMLEQDYSLREFDTPAEKVEFQYQGGHEAYNYNR
jgi:hypothetical protein